MAIWHKKPQIQYVNERRENTLVEHLGIMVESIGDDYLVASMPVDKRTHQPMGILHGGASIALAETVGSIAANLVVDDDHFCVGLEVNGNHVKSVTAGKVYARATPAHLGRTTQVWEIKITNEDEKTVCVSRLTMAVIKKP